MIAFASLPKAEQDAAVSALAQAAAAAARPDLVPLLAHKIGRTETGLLLSVEVPRHAKHRRDQQLSDIERIREQVSTRTGGANPIYASVEEEQDAWWIETDLRWLPLGEAIALLASPQNPEIEVERRRKFVADKQNAADQRRAENERIRQEQAATREAWVAKNGARQKRFAELPHDVQVFWSLADRMPAHRELLIAIAKAFTPQEIGAQKVRQLPPLPDCFP
jgi:hypothetical protein